MYNLIPVAAGLCLLFARNKIMDYYDYFNKEYDKPLNRKIWKSRLTVSSGILIAAGIINLIRTY